MTKQWWKSKTLWFNLLAATLLLAQQNIESLSGILPDSLVKPVAFALPIINIWLRAITTHGLSFTPRMPVGEKDGQ